MVGAAVEMETKEGWGQGKRIKSVMLYTRTFVQTILNVKTFVEKSDLTMIILRTLQIIRNWE